MKRIKEKDFLKRIGSNISRLRKEKKWTIKRFGQEFDPELEKSNIIPIEKGRINITVNTLFKFADALDVDVMELLKKH